MINIQRYNLTHFVEENILSHLTKSFKVSYNPFDIYVKDKEDMEYLIGFTNDDNVMVITVYYTPSENNIKVTSLGIGSTIKGEQITTYTLTKNYKQDIKKLITKLEKLMFTENTI